MAKCGVSWCLLGLLGIIALLANNAVADQGPTVNECRVHVEAALKQYWSHPAPAQSAAPAPDSDPESTDDEANSEAEDPPAPVELADDGDSDSGSDGGDEADQGTDDLQSSDDSPLNEPEETESQTGDDDDDSTDDEDDHSPEANPDAKEDNDDEHDNGQDSGDESEEEPEDKDEGATSNDQQSDAAPEVAEAEDTAAEDGDDDDDDDDDSTDDDEAATEESVVPEDAAGAGVEPELSEPESSTEQSEDKTEDAQDETPVADEPAAADSEDQEGDAEESSDDEPDEKTADESEESEQEEQETGMEPVELGGDIDEDDEDEIPTKVLVIRTRQHIDDILGLDDIGTESDKDEEWLVTSTLKDLKKSYDLAIKPMEGLYKYRDISNRVLGDAEVFGKPTILFLGPWSSGKSSIINYLLGVERTPSALKTSPEPTDTKFTVVTYGEKNQVVSGTEMAADWPYSTVQKFGQGFLDHFRGIKMPHRLLQKVTLVDTPGIMETRKQQDKGYPFNEAFQWFIDRADAIYIVFDPAKLEIGNELEAILDQLKGREAQIRFILNKADAIRRRDVMRITGQLFWNLSPLLGSSEAPVIYTVSLITKPFHPGSPAKFLLEQEKALLHDIKVTMDKRVENRISYSRRHAVRVRNHAKMVDCYLATYFRHKSIFSNRKQVAESITENPSQYSIYAGLSALTNVSRYDLPDPDVYRDFFRLNPLYDFKALSATCSYFKGCPLDKLDMAIAYDLPELLGKYKKRTKITPSEWDDEKGR